jgi:Protein of unknown function (DUF1549)/Protein of unknown function (DUF1553)
MQPSLQRCLPLMVVCFFPCSALAQPPLSQRIDQLIAAGKADFAQQAAANSSDAEFLRRITLDLTGIVPSAAETRAFLADTAGDKRLKLIDSLLQSDGFTRHMTTTFDVLLMDRRADKHVKRPEWVEYLRSSFAANKPYDKLVAEIVSADGTDPKMRSASRFFLDRDGEANVITKDLSRLFLGMNLTCCQCHDHPLIDGYKQQHYYGILAFFNRSFVFTDKATKQSVLAEKGEGDVTFQSVFKAKITNNTGPQLPGGPVLSEPKFDKGKEYVVAFKPGDKPQPKFSRRAQFAQQLTANPRFARAAANRFWSLYLGRGIVHPVELDHDANPPSHPDLLKILADDFAARKFDVKTLVKEIVSSQTYQRSSEPPKGVKDVNPASFTVYPLRPLTPEQLAWSIMQATGLLDAERKAQPKADGKVIFTKLAANVQTFVGLFGSLPGEPFDPSNFEATLDQTLFLDNGALLRSWLAPRPGSLTQRLDELKDAGAIAEEAYVSVLTRMPTADERKEVADFLARRAADRPVALQDLAWALLASAEFRFNH